MKTYKDLEQSIITNGLLMLDSIKKPNLPVTVLGWVGSFGTWVRLH